MSASCTVHQTIHVEAGAVAITRVFPKKYLKDMDYIRVCNDKFLDLALNGNFHAMDWKVLTVCLTHMEFENRLDMSQLEIGNLLQVKQSAVARSLKKLIGAKCLRVETVRGKQNIYFINPNLAFKTVAPNLAALKEVWGEDGEPEGDD
jgi:hypothetical protein